MSGNKSTTSATQANGNVCPICGKRAYSKGGIHPQCAVLQADAARTEELKAQRKLDAETPKESSWSKKKCPKCSNELHVRKKVCDCGHAFF
ncbi:hypothetical protein RMSM_00834 [Rhodopirellula maiorica SM1]|uniref:Uncharacterized protein n=1 Tax=Rhodopirellula maiorica SM1 TaxID=1265738 RepID=M5RSP6_9BACT|nr:hypothetical protein [Rhodopirellula maiorica]EMI22236.1 hypothetical protein RMSM_00834 [Rhodopirellula maiorica SM1]